MDPAHCKHKENYYTFIQGVKVYVDYTNERLKIPDCQNISEAAIKDIIDFSQEKQLGKILSNCRIAQLETFKSCNFELEGTIPGYFQGEDAYCVSYFLDPKRKESTKKEEEASIISQCENEGKRYSTEGIYKYTIRQAAEHDIPQMINLFSAVFETYPTPVFSKQYLKQVMDEHVLFKVAEEEGRIISIASADMDKSNLNAEITDCATDPEHRGRGILPNLINSLETSLQEKGFLTAYSLSRAINPGINKALSRSGYKYCGRQVNNCHICGGYEDMNIWVKHL